MTRAGGPAVGLMLAAFGGAAVVAALLIGTGWGAGSWGPRAVPLLAGGTMVLAGLADAYRSWGPAIGRSLHRSSPHGSSSDGASSDAPGRWQVPLLLALAVGYVLLIDRTGYLLATALAAPLAFALFGMRSPVRLALVALAVPLALHVVFFRLLNVFPPLGSWFDLSDVLPV